MKILVLYFSGTGNTKYIARYIANSIRSSGRTVNVKAMEHFQKQQISEYDLLILGFPIYACSVPFPVRDFLEGIPLTASKGVFLFCTKGFYSGNVLGDTESHFASIGYIPLGSADITMPGSDGLAFMSKSSPIIKSILQKDYRIIKPADRMIDKVEKAISTIDGKGEIKASSKRMHISIAGLIVGGLFGLIYKPIENSLKRKLRADEKCIRCKLCEKMCPFNNIKVTASNVEFGDRCCLCLRCLHQCPKEAIQMGKGTIGKFRWKGPDGGYNPLDRNTL